MKKWTFPPSSDEGTALVIVPGFQACSQKVLNKAQCLCVSIWQLTQATQGRFPLEELLLGHEISKVVFYDLAVITPERFAEYRKFLSAFGLGEFYRAPAISHILDEESISGNGTWSLLSDYGSRYGQRYKAREEKEELETMDSEIDIGGPEQPTKADAEVAVLGANLSAVEPRILNDPRFLIFSLADTVKLQQLPPGIKLAVIVTKSLLGEHVTRLSKLAKHSISLIGGTGKLNNWYGTNDLTQVLARFEPQQEVISPGQVSSVAPPGNKPAAIAEGEPSTSVRAKGEVFSGEESTNAVVLGNQSAGTEPELVGTAKTTEDETIMPEVSVGQTVRDNMATIGDDNEAMIKFAIKAHPKVNQTAVKQRVWSEMARQRRAGSFNKTPSVPPPSPVPVIETPANQAIAIEPSVWVGGPSE